MTSEVTVLALDPGKLTGTVVLHWDGISEPKIVTAFEPTQYAVCEWVELLLANAKSMGQPIDIVMEKFTITTETGKKKDVNYSLEIIGAVKYLAEKYGFTYSFQTPAEAMSFVSNDRIRALNLWVPGGEGHHKDAMRHAIKYLIFKKGWRPEGLIS